MNDENLKKGKKFKSDDEATRNAGRNGGIASGKAKREKKRFKELFEELLEEEIVLTVQGVKRKLKRKEAIAIAQINKAIKGDLNSMKEISKYIEEAPVDTTIGLDAKVNTTLKVEFTNKSQELADDE